jgi:LysM repeat protein
MQPWARAILALIFAAVAIIPAAGSASASEVHIVQPGETLSQIAKQYRTTVANLQELNDLPDANFVWSGQRLLIDAGETAAPAPQRDEAYQLYTVQPGDTLFLLAGKHGISLTRLMSINGFSSEEWLSLGQELLVPRALAPADRPVHPVTGLQPAPPVKGMQPGGTRPAVHTVQTGELLPDIAERYGVNPGALARLNDLQNNSALEPGRVLRIPTENALELLEGISQRLDRALYPTRTERWIEVDLNQQMAIAYEGVRPVKAFVISSGFGDNPTVAGTFRIWVKIAMQDMRGGSRAAGDAYHVEEVKNVLYFHEDYAFHGTYWHSNFGTPMSRGCINMTEEEAEWLFDWASPFMYDGDDDGWMFSTDANPGTLVLVHER